MNKIVRKKKLLWSYSQTIQAFPSILNLIYVSHLNSSEKMLSYHPDLSYWQTSALLKSNPAHHSTVSFNHEFFADPRSRPKRYRQYRITKTRKQTSYISSESIAVCNKSTTRYFRATLRNPGGHFTEPLIPDICGIMFLISVQMTPDPRPSAPNKNKKEKGEQFGPDTSGAKIPFRVELSRYYGGNCSPVFRMT